MYKSIKEGANYGYPLPKIMQPNKPFQDHAIGNGIQNPPKKTGQPPVCKINNRYPCAFKNFH